MDKVWVLMPYRPDPVPVTPKTERVCVKARPDWIFFFNTEEEIGQTKKEN